jgi:hypothetical protein
MGSTIFQAPPYDARRERRKKIIIVSAIAVAFVAGLIAYSYRHYAYEHLVARFFASLQSKDYETAYALWLADPEWKEHLERYSRYPFSAFYRDWGPGGEYGLIRTFEIEGSTDPGGTGVVVRVQVNGRSERADIWVEKQGRTLTLSPFQTIQ